LPGSDSNGLCIVCGRTVAGLFVVITKTAGTADYAIVVRNLM
jgi:hypothetical protein